MWRRPPPNQIWIPGSWNKSAEGWIWACGFWSAVPQNQLVLIPQTPPIGANDNVPPSPGNNFFWVSGYWSYSASTKQYTWLSGKWNPFNQNWILTPASYVWRPNGYIFCPMYWDWSLENRGNAYSCQSTSDPLIIIEPTAIIERLFICYPDYITLYSYWWNYHPGWWNGCWCLPPWWAWTDWWTFSWDDLWQLWWWWGDPDAFPPFWIILEISSELAPPPEPMIEFMRHLPRPHFPTTPGDRPLRPTGPLGGGHIPRPRIPTPVTPGGSVTTPSTPQTPQPPTPQITIPPTPPAQTPSTPSGQTPYYPPQINSPEAPPSYSPPSQYYPPNTPYYPPHRNPEQPTRPYNPPSPPPSHHTPNTPNYTPPRYPNQPTRPYNPPSQTQPNQPTRPYNPPSQTQPNPSPNYTPPSRTQPHTPPVKIQTAPPAALKGN